MSLARNVFVQTSFTLISRVLGFARDTALAARLGQGGLMDAWATAQMLPNMFRRLFAEGAFSQAFVPVYAKSRAVDGPAAADEMATHALALIMTVVAVVVIGFEIALPWLMPYLLSAYRADPQMLQTATLMAQLTMPYLAAMTLASLLSGVLNTLGRFALSSGAQLTLNVFTLIPLLLVKDRQQAALWAAAATTLAGVGQGALLWWGVARMKVNLRVGLPVLSKAVQHMLAIAVPGAIAGGAIQLNTLVSQLLSGSDEGARSVLYQSDRLYQLPLGLIGVAVGLALVPRLSRHFAESDHVAANQAMDDGITLSMAFTLPAALALLLMPFFIIDATVSRGAFSVENAHRTAEVLRQFAWGAPAFVLAKVFTPPFFARHRTKQPMQFSIATVFVTIALGATLWFTLPRMGIDGAIGLAVATSMSGWINVFLLAGTLAREKVYVIGARAWARLARMGLACAVMGAFVAFAAWQYSERHAQILKISFGKELAVLVVTAAAFLIFFVCALLFRAVTLKEIVGSMRREKGAAGVPTGGDF